MPDPSLIRDGIRESDLGNPAAVITHPEPHLVQVVMPTDDWDHLFDGVDEVPDDAHDDCGAYNEDDVLDARSEGEEDGYAKGWNGALDAVRALAEAS